VRELIFDDQAPREFAAPVPYFATHDTATSTELEGERDALVASLPELKGGARSKADHRIRVLEREIRKALEMEETARRTTERVRERQRQQIGADSPFARQTLAELVAATVAGVNAVGQNRNVHCRREGPTVRAYAAQGKRAEEVKGMFGTAIMVR
jgi:hypothetical protein